MQRQAQSCPCNQSLVALLSSGSAESFADCSARSIANTTWHVARQRCCMWFSTWNGEWWIIPKNKQTTWVVTEIRRLQHAPNVTAGMWTGNEVKHGVWVLMCVPESECPLRRKGVRKHRLPFLCFCVSSAFVLLLNRLALLQNLPFDALKLMQKSPFIAPKGSSPLPPLNTRAMLSGGPDYMIILTI